MAPPAPITVRYFAGARAAAGTSEETVPAATLADLLTALGSRHGDQLGRVLSTASFLVDGTSWHDHTAPLPPESTVDVLPPFAGG